MDQVFIKRILGCLSIEKITAEQLLAYPGPYNTNHTGKKVLSNPKSEIIGIWKHVLIILCRSVHPDLTFDDFFSYRVTHLLFIYGLAVGSPGFWIDPINGILWEYPNFPLCAAYKIAESSE